jgi:hypothetical protein
MIVINVDIICLKKHINWCKVTEFIRYCFKKKKKKDKKKKIKKYKIKKIKKKLIKKKKKQEPKKKKKKVFSLLV